MILLPTSRISLLEKQGSTESFIRAVAERLPPQLLVDWQAHWHAAAVVSSRMITLIRYLQDHQPERLDALPAWLTGPEYNQHGSHMEQGRLLVDLLDFHQHSSAEGVADLLVNLPALNRKGREFSGGMRIDDSRYSTAQMGLPVRSA